MQWTKAGSQQLEQLISTEHMTSNDSEGSDYDTLKLCSFLGFSDFLYVHHVHTFVNNSPYDFLLKKPSCFFHGPVPDLGAELRKLATDESAQKAAPETLVDWFEELELENGIKILKKCLKRKGGLKLQQVFSIIL